MTITTLSGRELNHNLGSAKKATKDGAVFITDRGRPAYVLLSFEAYQRLTQQEQNIADLLALPGAEDVGFDPPRLRYKSRPVDFS
jgi:prevent-host-death family protein